MTDDDWMRQALAEARRAGDAGEVPVGAVLVKDGVRIASGRNAPVAQHDPSAHAEIAALRTGAAALGNYRLDGCELFVTLEPCAMCAGAMLHARISRVVFGATDPKTGAAGSVLDLFASPQLNHQTTVQGGVMAAESGALLQAFFQQRRSDARGRAEPLRDNALRTPLSRFDGLADDAFASHYIDDLPSLNGWRLHYRDEGVRESPILLAIHGPGEWSYLFRHLIGAPGWRTLAPDLIGFGRSDKPKREAVHRLEWHRDVLAEWLDRVAPIGQIVLMHSAAGSELASMLARKARSRFAGVLLAPDGDENAAAAWQAPFPDRGYEAALRALGNASDARAGPTPSQAAALLQHAMGYLAP
ncbi:MAG: tRNA adenosine(34) deaminase TadA [Comamonadaceae bacterium]|nr:MAG: tRNA adenosine(34) deaminase TadA [Comamonadaceae bacterium]